MKARWKDQKKAKGILFRQKEKAFQQTQFVADRKSKRIICTAFGKGRKHDFKLFRQSGVHIHTSKKILVDTGYQGMQKLYSNTEIPKKKTKKKPLDKEARKRNREISSERVLIENVIREVKIFRVAAEKYRNRRKRFGLRINLIAAFYNRSIDLKLKK